MASFCTCFNSPWTRTDKTAVTYIEVALYKPPFLNVDLFKLFLYKEADRIPSQSSCLLTGSWYFSQQRVRYGFFFKHEFNVLDIKLLMIAAYLTLVEVIWLLFELVLIVLSTRTF